MTFLNWFRKGISSEQNKLKTRKIFNWTLDESKYLNLDKVKQLRAACQKAKILAIRESKPTPVRDWFMVELGLFSGLRVEEMTDLKVSDLHIKEEESSLTVRKGKGGKSRTIQIKGAFKHECLFYLNWKKEQCQDISPEACLLTGPKDNPLTTRALQKAFKRCLKKAGLDDHYSIHCLRHTYGSHLYKASQYNLRLVQEQLGHSSIRTTQVYANLMDNDVKEAAENLYVRGDEKHLINLK